MPSAKSRAAEIAIVRPSQPRTGYQAVAGATERRLSGALEVPLEQVVPDPAQPRQDWRHGEGERRLEELAASIGEFGVLQPLLVREEGTLGDGRQRYVIIAGGRRYAAAQRAGLVSLPVVVRGEEPQRVRVLQLIENLQRQDLSPIDEAHAYQELMELDGLTPPALAARLHISAQHVRDRLRMLADQVLADAVGRGQISATAARDIMQLPDEEVQAFRLRVLAGERLQTNDVVAVRARLVAAGAINPRRKLARPTPSTSAPSPSPEPAGQAAAPRAERFPAAPAPDAAPVPVDARLAMATPATNEPPAEAPAHEVAPPACASVPADRAPAEVARALLLALPADARRDLVRILDLGAEAGWSCADLLVLVRATDRA